MVQGLLGIGGGPIVVPALCALCGLSQKEAQATSLWYMVPTAFFSAVLYTRSGHNIRPSFVGALVAAGLLGAAIGVPLVKRIHQRQLQRVFGVAAVVIAGMMFWRSLSGNITPIQDNPELQYLVLTWTGLLAGFMGSLLGLGGGVIVVPMLVLLGAFGQKTAQGMALLYIVPTALFSVALYRFHARIMADAVKVLLMVTAGLAGGFLGCQLVEQVSNEVLRLIFAAALAALGIVIVMRGKRPLTGEEAPDWVI